MKNAFLIVTGLVIAGLSGWVHGRITDRWGAPSNVVAVAQQLEQLTLDIPGWTTEPAGTIDEHTRKLAGAEGYFSHRYVHNDTGAIIHVTILCGRPGPISLHSPEYCFVLSGMLPLTDAIATPIGDQNADAGSIPAEFWRADYSPPPSKGGADVRTFWAWSTDGQAWSIPETPRLAFANSPLLYRLYFTAPRQLFDTPQPAGPESSPELPALRSSSPVEEFMPAFLKRFAEITRNNSPTL